HLLNRPHPDVILLLAARPVGVEADRVVPDLVEEDRQADGGLGDRRLDPVHDAAVVVVDAPGAAGHAATPAADAQVEAELHQLDNIGPVDAHAASSLIGSDGVAQ